MKLMNWSLCCVATAFVLALPGCGKKNAGASPKNPDPMMVIPPEPATPGLGTKPASAQEELNTVADLEMLNKTLREYVRLKKVIPNDLNDLVTSGFARSLPIPPQGRRFVIVRHPLGYQVILADQ
jgi:hypothetical protein